MTVRPPALILAAALAASGAAAEDGARNTPPQRRQIQVEVFGNDPCPKGQDGEIIVCARRPEAERFRIPPTLRRKPDARTDQSWVARTRDIEETARSGRPNSCSPVGTGGQTGCFDKFMRDQAAAKRADDAAAADTP